VFRNVNRFLDTLVTQGVACENLMASINTRYGKRGWLAISRALHSPEPLRALDALPTESPFKGAFGEISQAYLELKQSSGPQCLHIKRALTDFNRFLNKHSITSVHSITTRTIHTWASQAKGGQNSRREKALTLRKFFSYLVTLGIVRHNPVTAEILDSIGPHQRHFKPYIYSQAEVATLLQAASELNPSRQFKLKAETMYVVISLLYTLGLRIGEVCRLNVSDIDLEQKTILVRNSKFYKDRILPFGPKLAACLKRYLEARHRVYAPLDPTSPLFVASRDTGIDVSTVGMHFRQLLNAAGIDGGTGCNRPRLHDLRHGFAVGRLLRWYKEGVDVQSRLVHLSTFMGHVGIESTQVYLNVTDELLLEANKRFYVKCGKYTERGELS